MAEQTARLQASNEELRRLSITDELTGLYNRRHLVERLENEIERLNRTESPIPLSFAILDLDHFKRINDIHGHVIGDRVLQAVGERIAARVRQTDLAARYGGEEFAIIMPMTDAEGARILIEDLRRNFDDEALRVIPGKPTHLTVSAGVATETGRAHQLNTGHRLEQIVRKADDMLYRAKEKGRNRTEPAGPEFPGRN